MSPTIHSHAAVPWLSYHHARSRSFFPSVSLRLWSVRWIGLLPRLTTVVCTNVKNQGAVRVDQVSQAAWAFIEYGQGAGNTRGSIYYNRCQNGSDHPTRGMLAFTGTRTGRVSGPGNLHCCLLFQPRQYSLGLCRLEEAKQGLYSILLHLPI